MGGRTIRKELFADLLVDARMTGAGFGSCAIAIVEKQLTDSFIIVVGKKYEEQIGYGGTFYIASIGDGAREINREVII
ncbi:hypothetical protein [Pelosinus fermentans]|uniref:Uncharacterized protein n=1 Tax=Pelosinus fermentans JBW45 TaxID=1192197 RepID=I9NTE4_9FIRM|nr:hypothetical protein [Pelosinus fermentans]AJQ26441.1 hypothetical protein JBW_01089 [Pelosinus fermentans JBW45]